jgi:hypothetical protein
MSRYEVQFRSSGIVAFSASERGICQHWLECNDYEPETPFTDLETGNVEWVRGECLGLFTIKKVKVS